MKLKFLGASGTVTGSCYCLSGENTSIMIDCGMFQGVKEVDELNQKKPAIDIEKLDSVILTHAHLDHCGRLPLLLKYGFKGVVYMNEPTKALAEIVLLDSAKIAREDSTETLYDEDDVFAFLKKVVLVEYHKPFTVGGFEAIMYDAGHILGSASILFTEIKTDKKVLFSGDLGNSPEPLLMPTETIKEADIVVMESTYGDEKHPIGEESEVIAEIVAEAEHVGGAVLIPSFSIQRAQELLYLFDGLKKEGKVKEETVVFLDSPMALKTTEVYKDYPGLYSSQLKNQVKSDDPFDFPGLILCDSVEKSKQIKNYPGAKVIIAGSGMMTGGRIMHHAINYLSDPKNTLVFVGFQAEGTLGREIKSGKSEVNIWGNAVEIRADVKEIKTMSSHADQDQLWSWFSKVGGIKKVFLTHGEDMARLVFKEIIKNRSELSVEVEMPKLDQEYEL